MNKAANTYWVDNRLRDQRISPRLIGFNNARTISRELIGSPDEVRRRGGLVPAWVIFAMIIFASAALCISTNLRTHAEMLSASQEFGRITAEVEALRLSNNALKAHVRRLRDDPVSIESAARERLNMVRSNELVVPIE